MLSKIELNKLLSAEQNRLSGRNVVETFFRQNYEKAKLQTSQRMREQNAKEAAKKITAVLLGKIPYAGSAVKTIFEKAVHNKTLGEILDEAMVYYNISDIYAKEIAGEVNEGTVKLFVKAQIYLELADALMECVELQQKYFVDGVRMQLSLKDGVVRRELQRVLTSNEPIELDDLAAV